MPSNSPAGADLRAAAASIAALNSAGPPGLTTCPVAVSREAIAGSSSTALHVGRDALAHRGRHVARAEQADQSVDA